MLRSIYILSISFLLFSCNKKEDLPTRGTGDQKFSFTLANSTGKPGFCEKGIVIKFEIQSSFEKVDYLVQPFGGAEARIKVEDGERLNIIAIETEDNQVIAESSVQVILDRPSEINDKEREIHYCKDGLLDFYFW